MAGRCLARNVQFLVQKLAMEANDAGCDAARVPLDLKPSAHDVAALRV